MILNLLKKSVLSHLSCKENIIRTITTSVSQYYFNKTISSVKYSNSNQVKSKKEVLNRENIYSKYSNIITILDSISKQALSFKEFRFLPQIYNVLEKMSIISPTSIQNTIIPKLLNSKEHIFFASNTGMGKTLSYLLPIVNHLKINEITTEEILTKEKRPRCIIIVPSRELAQQVEEVAKEFIYDLPLKVKSLFVGQDFSKEREFLEKGVDILITTPERLKRHWVKENVFLTNLNFLVIDELDTLLDAGYSDLLEEMMKISIRRGVYNVENKKKISEEVFFKLIMASTTLTQSIDVWLDEIFNKKDVFLIRNNEYLFESKLIKLIDKSTNHNLSNVKHQFIHVTEYDKFNTLINIVNEKYVKTGCKPVLSSMTVSEKKAHQKGDDSIIIFCNSINCVRKVEYILKENGIEASCIHGDIPPFRRQTELYMFKSKKRKILVCTDIISRGLDFPFVYYVINFDFPISLSDYVHRAGRTGRAGREGLCISLFRRKNEDVVDEIRKSQEMKEPLNIQRSMFSMKNKETLSKLTKESEESEERIKKIEKKTGKDSQKQLKGRRIRGNDKGEVRRKENDKSDNSEKERIIKIRERRVLFERKSKRRNLKRLKGKVNKIKAEMRSIKKKE